MVKNILRNRKGSLMEAALVLPILTFIVFFTFDLGIRMMIGNGAFTSAREVARTYASTQDLNLATQRGTEAFKSIAGSMATIENISVNVTNGAFNSYAVATVTVKPKHNAFEFAWKLLNKTPNPTISKTMVYPIEPKSGSKTF